MHGCSYLQLLIDDERLKTFLELFQRHFLAFPLLQTPVDGLRRDENVAHDVDDAVGCDAV